MCYVSTDLATWLQLTVETKGLSCRANAADLGITLPSLPFLMNERSRPKPDPVQKIATHFHADVCFQYDLAGYKPY